MNQPVPMSPMEHPSQHEQNAKRGERDEMPDRVVQGAHRVRSPFDRNEGQHQRSCEIENK